MGMKIIGGLATVITNVVVKMLLNKVQVLRRCKTQTDEANWAFKYCFYCLFFNICIVPIIAMMRLTYNGNNYIPA